MAAQPVGTRKLPQIKRMITLTKNTYPPDGIVFWQAIMGETSNGNYVINFLFVMPPILKKLMHMSKSFND
jgi:hypothetical protein